ncbi:hypothetical protein FOVG_18339 [Fusarium oxysporum f. sp. pisi HDV247]|uniref:Uncharacterized protein n=1 Tax=Fusarium oxysporum f. sp. pisi HDV247 TaxID=1080344 RepID=W9NJQ6_FUSOX|nr:hypothetical protein FOVG_18339 [Fusarium oxysporum f. sp. pisi HDV247]
MFQAFCDKFEKAVKQFTTGPEREFAQKFVDSFLGSWNQALTDAKSAPVPTTYSAIAASTPSTTTPTTAPSSPVKTDHERPLRVDLRVFIRLDGEAPARAHNDYAVRAHMSRKLQRQTEWAPDLGAAAVETKQEWCTYLVSDSPRKLIDLYGNEADSDAAVDKEIEI